MKRIAIAALVLASPALLVAQVQVKERGSVRVVQFESGQSIEVGDHRKYCCLLQSGDHRFIAMCTLAGQLDYFNVQGRLLWSKTGAQVADPPNAVISKHGGRVGFIEGDGSEGGNDAKAHLRVVVVESSGNTEWQSPKGRRIQNLSLNGSRVSFSSDEKDYCWDLAAKRACDGG